MILNSINANTMSTTTTTTTTNNNHINNQLDIELNNATTTTTIMCSNAIPLSTIRTDIIRNNNLNNINNNLSSSINTEHQIIGGGGGGGGGMDVIDSAPTIIVKPSTKLLNGNNNTNNNNNNFKNVADVVVDAKMQNAKILHDIDINDDDNNKIIKNFDDNYYKTTTTTSTSTNNIITQYASSATNHHQQEYLVLPTKGVQLNLKEMEIIPQGKHFRMVDDSELPEIMNILGRYLPESLKFHQTIKTYLNDRVWQFYFYVSNKWPEEPICLHFPGCTLTPNNNIYESIAIFCPTSHIQCVDLLEDENLIDWKKPLYLNYTHKDIMERIDLFYKEIGTMDCLSGDIYVFKNFNRLSSEELPSNEVEMRALTVDNVKAIHDLYPASEIECVEVFEKLVQVLPGVGIFIRNTDELAAWMVHSYYGAMFSMQTKPEFRRKGYGIHLARSLTNLVMKRGYSPFVIIRPENDASRNLYIKLGFEKVYETVRAKLNPFKDTADNNGDEHNCKNNRDLKNENENINEIFENKCKVNED